MIEEIRIHPITYVYYRRLREFTHRTLGRVVECQKSYTIEFSAKSPIVYITKRVFNDWKKVEI